MEEYISREAALKAIYTSTAPALEVKAMPAADVVEVRHGRWVNEKYVWQGLKSAQCNQCKRKTDYYIQPKYCPKCGAKMDGGQDDV